MGIKGLDHDNINTSNMKDTMSFYTDLLDFTWRVSDCEELVVVTHRC